jgi:hypothetical protein
MRPSKWLVFIRPCLAGFDRPLTAPEGDNSSRYQVIIVNKHGIEFYCLLTAYAESEVIYAKICFSPDWDDITCLRFYYRAVNFHVNRPVTPIHSCPKCHKRH